MCVTNSKNWEEACLKFPDFVTSNKLEQFTSLNFRNNIPEIFRNYCEAALSRKHAVAGVCGSGESPALLVCCNVTTQEILAVYPKFAGAHLIITSIANVSYLFRLLLH